ncbi:hypothetical protein MFLAVUS_008327 [Mucor flavus]|uniref:Uncharacterized protein n=1 Tax=Mucor flavus TaxID=439312 RepID=A0ABP9Z6W1_9FUNG
MTHLSDFSFLQRTVSFAYLFIWYTYRVWTLDKFSCLHPKRFRQGELKSIVTLLILFMIPFQLFYDITSVKIKYEEGFANVLGHVFTKPEVMWTKADRDLVIPTEYSLCIGFSLQTGTLVLLQCFWNYLANSITRTSFMTSREFRFYIAWTFSSFIVFPILQYNFSREIYEPTYKEIMPEMVYGIELFIVACLGVVSHFRFRKLLLNSRDTTNGRSITQKIRYFQEINLVLSTVLFGHGTLLTILSCDGLTARKTLNIHKFSADFFICNINICAVITWFCMILIFHPKHNHAPVHPSDEDFLADGTNGTDKQINNQSGISSNYAQASTLVFDSSQSGSEYTYSKSGVHPLSQSGITNCDSAFQFGPLPIAPNPVDVGYRKNNSITSTAPSLTTLVSHHQHSMPSKGSCGRSMKGFEKADYLSVSVADENKPDPYYLDESPTVNSLALQPIQTYQELEENEEYAPPPLSPARKNRDVIHSLRPEQDRSRYTHSMMIVPCDEDIGEFGINPVPKPATEESRYISMSHSTSSLLLPLPFEDTFTTTPKF